MNHLVQQRDFIKQNERSSELILLHVVGFLHFENSHFPTQGNLRITRYCIAHSQASPKVT
jgi:hypothetical protein